MSIRKAAQRRLIIDDLAMILRKPSAAPTITPSEVIALALNGAQWVPGARLIGADDIVVFQILRLLQEAGWKIEAR